MKTSATDLADAGCEETLVLDIDWRDDGSAVISVSGELDLDTAPRLQQHIRQSADRLSGDIRLDVARLRFCDATGLGVITVIDEQLRRRGHRLHIDHPSPQLLRVLDITETRYLAE